jgi:hypothetical protein
MGGRRHVRNCPRRLCVPVDDFVGLGDLLHRGLVVGHAHQAAERNALDAVARRAHLPVHLEPAADRRIIKRGQRAVMRPAEVERRDVVLSRRIRRRRKKSRCQNQRRRRHPEGRKRCKAREHPANDLHTAERCLCLVHDSTLHTTRLSLHTTAAAAGDDDRARGLVVF